MRRILTIVCITIAMIAMGPRVFAQHNMTVTIPFNFRAGSALMPAGTYIAHFGTPSGSVFIIGNQKKSVAVLAEESGAPTTPVTKLVFRDYGDGHYFLAGTMGAEGSDDRHFTMSGAEKRLRTERASAEPGRQVLLAMR